ncbi:glutathione S-transferase family protein [Glycocaulis abyssi]|uniref:Glutathione S-transferase family protein n=1 Tax=Glycocaulis abyssi TaxID=1433403 RepID=A0ABV9N9G5_9PROT
MTIKLYANAGWGSAIVEAQLAWYGIDFQLVESGDLFQDAAAREKLATVNPLAQVPTLVPDSGEILTESAAITLYLADLTGSDALVPGPDSPERSAFLRWLVFIVANIYPTYTYADDPSRFVAEESARKPFFKAVNAYAQKLYTQLDGAAGSPWFLGERMSALDIYIGVMTNWRPGKAWHEANSPRLAAIAGRVGENPAVGAVLARNFPDG